MSRPDLKSGQRLLLLLCSCGYTLFVIYGSLVPLEFRAQRLADAIERFQIMQLGSVGIVSRTDWAANVLLFIPLAFGWLGTMWSRHQGLRIVATTVVIVSCIALSAAIEFAQLYFPPRTTSLNDIVAESIGAVIGVACWWAVGPHTLKWVEKLPRLQGRAAVFGYLLTVYLLLLLGYSLLPLDLTLSPVEIFHKWQDGRLILLPFLGWRSYEGSRFIYELASDIVVWMVPAVLWVAAGERSTGSIFARLLGAAVLLEFLQLFVYSRVTDTTDILTAAIGAGGGVAIAARLVRTKISRRPGDVEDRARHRAAIWLGAAVAWALVLALVFWYPFDFRTDWSFVQARLATLRRVPLEALYYGSEFRAITEVFHKTSFFFPLGCALAAIVRTLEIESRSAMAVLHVISAGSLAAFAALIEVGQLFLPGRLADVTDWGLEVIGAWCGYAVALFVLSRLGALRVNDRRRSESPSAKEVS